MPAGHARIPPTDRAPPAPARSRSQLPLWWSLRMSSQAAVEESRSGARIAADILLNGNYSTMRRASHPARLQRYSRRGAIVGGRDGARLGRVVCRVIHVVPKGDRAAMAM